ncbi:hypothetical protein D9619_010437 [Psilocybe cf. subviscida]|uniref:Uncharacterized protein n=1 Tax=Psilocybe cf. subviscida TaxID=2480587 RepID=A0A8H5ASU8_9AGAR|nr:hypothetical protein D9619_010437 [Psilocybe cf. subviscida]
MSDSLLLFSSCILEDRGADGGEKGCKGEGAKEKKRRGKGGCGRACATGGEGVEGEGKGGVTGMDPAGDRPASQSLSLVHDRAHEPLHKAAGPPLRVAMRLPSGAHSISHVSGLLRTRTRRPAEQRDTVVPDHLPFITSSTPCSSPLASRRSPTFGVNVVHPSVINSNYCCGLAFI